MRLSFLLLLAVAIVTSVSCHKSNSIKAGDGITATGTLQTMGATTFMYGTHTLNGYVLESTKIDLDPFVGTRVIITAKNTHYHAELGPEMYDVIAIARIP
jgi:hypothetical protein